MRVYFAVEDWGRRRTFLVFVTSSTGTAESSTFMQSMRDDFAARSGATYKTRFSQWQWMFVTNDPTATLDLRATFRAYLELFATPDSDVPAAELIFGELLGNVVRYARGPVSFHLDWHAVQPTLLVTDEGPGFRGAPSGALDDLNAEGGRGLALVRALAVEMAAGNCSERGAYVRAVLPVRRLKPNERRRAPRVEVRSEGLE